jgi:hypothetical protein
VDNLGAHTPKTNGLKTETPATVLK